MYLDAAKHFYRALKVYPNTAELLDIYRKTVPEVLPFKSVANTGGIWHNHCSSKSSRRRIGYNRSRGNGLKVVLKYHCYENSSRAPFLSKYFAFLTSFSRPSSPRIPSTFNPFLIRRSSSLIRCRLAAAIASAGASRSANAFARCPRWIFRTLKISLSEER